MCLYQAVLCVYVLCVYVLWYVLVSIHTALDSAAPARVGRSHKVYMRMTRLA